MRRAAPRPPSHATPSIRWKAKCLRCQTHHLCLQNLERRPGSSLGKPGAQVMVSPPPFSPVSQDFRGFCSIAGEEANRWHCAVSGGAQPCWRPGRGSRMLEKHCTAGKFPRAGAQEKSPRGPASTLSCCFGPNHDAKRVCTQPQDIIG